MPEHRHRTKRRRRRTTSNGMPTATEKYYRHMFRLILISLFVLALLACLAIYLANKLGFIS